MRKSLIAQSIAVLAAGLVAAGSAHAIVTGPGATNAGGTAPGAGALPTDYNVPAAEYLVINPDGIGHKALVPYFTVQNGNDTYINIVNTDMRNGKALKVRFRGASNSDDVFDFTLLLSPGDVWAAAVTKGADGLPQLVTNDKSCSLPFVVSGQKFVTTRLDPSLTAAEKANEASEGYVEIFTMADIPPTIEDGSDADTDPDANPLYTAIKHVSGTPADCTGTAVNALFNDPTTYLQAQARGLEVPTTGLMVNWTIINVPTAASWTGAATALQAQTDVCQFCEPGYGNIVFFPQTATKITDVDLVRQYTSDPLLRGGVEDNTEVGYTIDDLGAPVIVAASFDFPDMSTPYLPAGLGTLADGEATKIQTYVLSRALSHSALSNEYVTDQGVLAQTDWVFSMPTRRYNVAYDYEGDQILYTDLSRTDTGADLENPSGVGAGFRNPTNFFAPDNTTADGTQICVTGIDTAGGDIGSKALYPSSLRSGVTGDREEIFATDPTDFVISPGEPAAPLTFCGEVSVLSFNEGTGTSLLGASVARKDLTVPYVDGWLRLATPGREVGGGGEGTETAGPARINGLPSVGFAAMRFTNSEVAAGTSGNFGLTFPHRNARGGINPADPD